MRLTERDFRLLIWIGEQLVVNKCELTELLALDAQKHHLELGRHVTAGLISRWRRYGLIKSFHQLQRGSHIYLTTTGLRAVGLNFKAVTPGRSAFSHLTHHDAVNRLRLHLERAAWRAGQHWVWLSERRLMQLERADGAYRFEKRAHRPDAVMRWDENTDIALEVERTYKRPKRLQSILGAYVYGSRYAQVRYYFSNEKIYLNLQKALNAVLANTPLMPQMDLQNKIQLLALPFDDEP